MKERTACASSGVVRNLLEKGEGNPLSPIVGVYRPRGAEMTKGRGGKRKEKVRGA